MKDTTRTWVRRYRWLLAGTGVLVIFLGYWALSGARLPRALSEFGLAVLPNLAAALLVYLAISFILARVGISEAQELRDEIATKVAASVVPAPGIRSLTSRVDELDWRKLFEESRSIDVIGRFFDGVLRYADSGLDTFFRKGGRIRVVTHDPADERLAQIADEQRNGDPRLHSDDASERFRRTLKGLHNARIRANAPADRIQVYVHETSINYAGYCFDDELLLLVPHAHRHVEEAREPQLLIDLTISPIVAAFWRNEIKQLTHASHLRSDLPVARS
jgi:hypothetical protein